MDRVEMITGVNSLQVIIKCAEDEAIYGDQLNAAQQIIISRCSKPANDYDDDMI